MIRPEDVRAHLLGEDTPARAMGMNELDELPSFADDHILANISASYFRLRLGLGILALLFPVALWVGAGWDHVQTSISAYYHYHHVPGGTSAYGTGAARDLFVGVLSAIGTFLFLYKGYSWQENWALRVAGVAALAVALFPMDWPPLQHVVRTRTAWIHYGSAVTFFLLIAYVCIARSGDTLKGLWDASARRRFRLWYRLLGALMIALPLTVVAINRLEHNPQNSLVVLGVEVAGISVFAIYWLVKSREIALIERQRRTVA